MKLNKKIKTHIVEMAIRSKYKEQFDVLMQAVKDKAFEVAYVKYHNDDFKVLSERALALVQTSYCININRIQMGSNKRCGIERGYCLSVALQTRDWISSISLDKSIYGAQSTIYNIEDCVEVELKALHTFLKETAKARETLEDAMSHYKSVKVMFKELPWTEEFYPEAEKKPVCNIVPVSTIAAANDLMGIKK